jgi:hypothetical protein
MLNGEATNTNFIVFGLTYISELELTIYRTRGEHANHYTTDAVVISYYQLHTDNLYTCDKITAHIYN